MPKFLTSKYESTPANDSRKVIATIPESRKVLRSFVHFLLLKPGSTAQIITSVTKSKNVRDLASKANQFLNKKGYFVASYVLPDPKKKALFRWAVFKKKKKLKALEFK